MDFKFEKKNFGVDNEPNPLYQYGVDLNSIIEDKEFALGDLDWWGWTPEIIQNIIDKSNSLEGDDSYEFQVDGTDLIIVIYTDYAYFFDWRTEKEEEEFSIPFVEFIAFMEEVKTFIEENS